MAIALCAAIIAEAQRSKPGKWIWYAVTILGLLPGLYIAWRADYLTSIRIQGLDPVMPAEYVLGILLAALWPTQGSVKELEELEEKRA